MKQDSWLYSDSFLKRAFAIWGHMMVAQLIIMVPLMILWILAIVMIVGTVMRSVPWDKLQEQGTQQHTQQQVPPGVNIQYQGQQ